MKRTALVIAAMALVTLVGCKAGHDRTVDTGPGGTVSGVEQGSASGDPGTTDPGKPDTAPGPGADTSGVDGDLKEINDLLNDADAELNGAEETPPDSD